MFAAISPYPGILHAAELKTGTVEGKKNNSA